MLKKKNLFTFFASLSIILVVTGCEKVDLFEKNAAIPGHQWSRNFKPRFNFTITDTVSPYRVFIVFRHNDQYNYNNIWIRLSTKVPGDTAVQKVQYELPLATSEGWISEPSTMDDLYEHRIQITPVNEPLYFRRRGDY